MNLISGIEVSYFRSFYKLKCQDLNDMTVVFGRNDSGKSNVLRALNLFFNGQTNPGHPFVFQRDLCHARMAEAEESKNARKFVNVKISFNTPAEWRRSLGNQLFVRKTWSVTTGQQYNMVSSVEDSSKDKYLTRFLNNIRFHYIPAIKDRKIFEHLLGQVYEVMAADKEFGRSLDNFAKQVRGRTESLSQELFENVGLSSTLAPPTQLGELFRSLDFETSTSPKDADRYSLTLQRGDGVQVRHIPAILKFICERDSKPFHIWGFEEPENSLELASCIAEAEYFQNVSRSKGIQIFATSHSPAFFNLDGPQVRRFFVSRANREYVSPTSEIVEIQPGDIPHELMGEAPHLAVLSPYLRDADKKLREITESRDELVAEINRFSRPVMFVEGVTDKMIVEKAWSVLFPQKQIPFGVEACGGTKKMSLMAAPGIGLQVLAPNRVVLCLVDNDEAGRAAYANGRLHPGATWQPNPNGTHWCRLHPTPEFSSVMDRFSVPEHSRPCVLESMFSAELRKRANAAGVYDLGKPFSELIKPDIFPRLGPDAYGADFAVRVYLLAPTGESKEAFASWICSEANRDPEVMGPLRKVLQEAAKLIDQGQAESVAAE